MLAITPAPEVLLRHDTHTVTLRASLRAAVALDSAEGGIGGLYDQVSRLSLTAIQTVIRCTATDRAEAEALLSYGARQPLAPFLLNAQAACAGIIRDLIPDHGTDNRPGKIIPLRDYFAELFKHATGWLGWTPSEIWTASVAEIEAALNAYCDKVTAASSDKDRMNDHARDEQRAQNIEAGLDPDFDRAALHRLKAKTKL